MAWNETTVSKVFVCIMFKESLEERRCSKELYNDWNLTSHDFMQSQKRAYFYCDQIDVALPSFLMCSVSVWPVPHLTDHSGRNNLFSWDDCIWKYFSLCVYLSFIVICTIFCIGCSQLFSVAGIFLHILRLYMSSIMNIVYLLFRLPRTM